MNEQATKTVKAAEVESLTVATKIDLDTWHKCEDRAFAEDRIKTNSGIVKAALVAYSKGK